MGKIKLLVLVSSISRNAGGLFTSVKELYKNQIIRDNFEIRIISFYDEYSSSDIIEWLPLEPYLCKKFHPYNFSYSPDMYSVVKKFNPDLIHLHDMWMYPSYLVRKLHKNFNIGYGVFPHGMLDNWALNQSKLKKLIATNFFEKYVLQNAIFIRALNISELRSIRDYGLSNPVAVIPNGISVPVRDPDLKISFIQNLDSNKKILLYLGRLHWKKGIIDVINAFDIMRQINKNFLEDWIFIIAGWDQYNYRKTLEKKVYDLKLNNYVKFVGPQYGNYKKALLQNSSAFILPSYSEGLPVSVLEAWSYNLPVLMTNECNLEESFDLGAAIKITHNPEDIAKSLVKFSEMSYQDLYKLKENGLKLIKEKYSWDKIAKDLSEVVEWSLNRHYTPSCLVFN